MSNANPTSTGDTTVADVQPAKTLHECFDQARVMAMPGTQEFTDLYQHLLVKNGHLVARKPGDPPGLGLPCGASTDAACGWCNGEGWYITADCNADGEPTGQERQEQCGHCAIAPPSDPT